MEEIEPRRLRHVIATVALVGLGLAGCGGGSDESATTSPTTASATVGAGELAGVHVDVRRDPG